MWNLQLGRFIKFEQVGRILSQQFHRINKHTNLAKLRRRTDEKHAFHFQTKQIYVSYITKENEDTVFLSR